MKKPYSLYAVVNSKEKKVRKTFYSRNAAVNYAIEKYYSTFEGLDVVNKKENHLVEYVYDPYNRFFVQRTF